ncbi:NAD(P)H-dependent oxidoreductase [Parasphingorhabdus pacifica]
MKVLWVFAHPEQRSLSASLRDAGIDELRARGEEVRLSDLYAMRWNPVVASADFAHDPRERLIVGDESRCAYTSGELSEDIRVEQEKLAWADAVVFQFPLWWYGMPAILKGWFDRVFVKGFAYGVRENGRTLRYGEGRLAGKRGMLLLTAGASELTMGPRGINGEVDDVLFGVQHGTLWYAGMSVLPPLVVHRADQASGTDFAEAGRRVRERVAALPALEPIAFRRQNGGDYDEDLVLRPEVAAGRAGLGVHRADSPIAVR